MENIFWYSMQGFIDAGSWKIEVEDAADDSKPRILSKHKLHVKNSH